MFMYVILFGLNVIYTSYDVLRRNTRDQQSNIVSGRKNESGITGQHHLMVCYRLDRGLPKKSRNKDSVTPKMIEY